MDRVCMSKINSYCQKNKKKLDYVEVDMRGPSHNPEFTVTVRIDGKEYGTAAGKSKKEAKAAAATKTWDMIVQNQDRPLNVHAPEPVTPPLVADALLQRNYVSLLNEYAQKRSYLVDYKIRICTGDAAMAPMFSCSCTISGHVYGNGTGNTVAAAKQAAAREAYRVLQEQESLTLKSENSSSTSQELLGSQRVPTQSESQSIIFKDSASNLVEKVSDMSLSEKPSNSQRNVPSSAVKFKRVLAANFGNARNKEQKNMMSNICRNNSEAHDNEYTVDERFRREYKNIEPIGKGGFGNVFKATSRIDEKTYAVKRVELIKNVMREVKELARLEHENIVRYYCSWEGNDHMTYAESSKNSVIAVPCLFIQMELCEQGPLDKWIENNGQNETYHKMAQDKFLQILKGVDYIHSKDLIHRDLKPQNIFLSHEGKIKIGDFGLVTSVKYETLTKNRGTQSYMAPEQFGDRYGKEVDIYALGLIWFEILSALVSHHEKNRVWGDVRDGQFPSDFNKQFTIQVPIIKMMLSKDPSKRGSASQILAVLKSPDKDHSHRAHSH